MYPFEKCLMTQAVIFLQLLSCVWLFATTWTAARHASLSFPISSCPQLFPASGSLPMSWLLPSGGQSIGASVSVSTSVLPIFRVDFLQNWLIWSPCSPRDSQDSSPAWQFESINSSALSLLYSPTLTSIHDYWKNHSFEHMELCLQSHVSAF